MQPSFKSLDFSIVSVAHAADEPLLRLQARSLNHYLERDFVREYVVVDNSMGKPIDSQALFSQCRLPVRVIRSKHIAPVPRASGWQTQQIYKLLVARHISSKYYILLDAKNHLVDHVSRKTFQAPDGRLCTGMHGYRQHPLRGHLHSCCRYFGLDPSTVLDQFLPTITPFVVPTDLVRNLLSTIEREGKPFAETFLAAGFTEFALFGTYLLHLGLEIADLYAANHWFSANLWREQSNQEMQQVIDHLARPFFAAHRKTFSRMNAATQQRLASLWHQRKLFASYRDAIRFVRGCAITYSV